MEDRNYTRLLIAIESFRLRYGAWPTIARMHPMQIDEIRRLLTPECFARVESRIRILPTEEVAFSVEDDEGRVHDYCYEGAVEGEPDIRAEEWLGHPEWRKPTEEEIEAYHRCIEELRAQQPDADHIIILP